MATTHPPPHSTGLLRDVPLSLIVKTLLGGFCNQFGWIFGGFGLLLVWGFVFNSSALDIWRFRGELRTAPGTLTRIEKTWATEGGSKHRRGEPIYAYHYEFEADGAAHSGISYALDKKLTRGQEVRVEFPDGRPGTSRLEAMRTTLFGPFAALVAVFPLIGAAFSWVGLRRSLRTIRLLRAGIRGSGKLVEKKASGGKINNRPVFRLTFEFVANDGRTYRVTTSTHKPELLEDDPHERLLYEPSNPASALPLDHLPGPPRFDGEGNVEPLPWLSVLPSCILPLLAVAAHGVYLVLAS